MLLSNANIADKDALFSEAFRVTKPSGLFGIYDVMLVRNCELQYPLPWAVEKDGSAIASADDYKSALVKAGFSLRHEDDRTHFPIFRSEFSAAMCSFLYVYYQEDWMSFISHYYLVVI